MKVFVQWLLLLLFIGMFAFKFLFLQLLRERHPRLWQDFGSPTAGMRLRDLSPSLRTTLRYSVFLWSGAFFRLRDRYISLYAIAMLACEAAFFVLVATRLAGAFD